MESLETTQSPWSGRGNVGCGGTPPRRGGCGSIFNSFAISDKMSQKCPVTVLKIHGYADFIAAPCVDKAASKVARRSFDEYFFPRSAGHTHFGYVAGTGKPYIVALSYVKITALAETRFLLDALAASTRGGNAAIFGSVLPNVSA